LQFLIELLRAYFRLRMSGKYDAARERCGAGALAEGRNFEVTHRTLHQTQHKRTLRFKATMLSRKNGGSNLR
jgi:hypothetical protein